MQTASRTVANSIVAFSALLLLTVSVAHAQQTGTVEGTVTDAASGAPIPGANILIEGTELGTATGTDGTYQIAGMEPGTYTLRASFVGYGEETEENVEVAAGQTTTVNIAMRQEAESLDEVVVVGYGEQQREDLTGSVSSVSSAEIEEAPVTSLDQAIQGRAAGVQVTRFSGEPGGGTTVRIRGSNSINASNEPLYVIDGVPVLNSIQSNSDIAYTSGPDQNPLAALNPDDIESIEILKDASATAIYGARGANGVVLVTTKSGSAGEDRISYKGSISSQSIPETLDLLNAREYATIANEARVNAGAEPIFTQEQIGSFGEGTNWQDKIFRTAFSQNHSLSLSGGDDDTQYYLSGNYNDEEGIIIASDFTRYAARVNLTQNVNERLEVGAKVNTSRTGADRAITAGANDASSDGEVDIVSAAQLYSPTASVFDASGNYALQDTVLRTQPNPVGLAQLTTNERTSTRLLGNAFANYDFTDGLSADLSFGANLQDEKTEFYSPTSVLAGSLVGGLASVSSAQETNWSADGLLKYDRLIGERHDLEATAGVTFQTARNEFTLTSTQDFPSDVTGVGNISAGTDPQPPSSNIQEWTLLSYLGRANYTFGGRYLLTATARYDGSSRFGENNKWGFFPSGALAWRASEEPFLSAVDALENLKLRVSYGQTGNQEIGLYNSIASLSSATAYLGETLRGGYAPASVANPNLKWEATTQLDVGLDVGFLDGRLRFTADYYRSSTSDLLIRVPLPRTSGFASALQNVGSMENEGLEFSLNTTNIDRGGFQWDTRFNITSNRNEVTDLVGTEQIFSGLRAFDASQSGPPSVILEGEPIGSFWGYRTDGIFNTQQELGEYVNSEGNPIQPDAAPGEIKYVDANSDGRITVDDRTVIGHPQPDFYGGLSNTFSYKGVRLSAFFQFSSGNQVLNLNALRLRGMRGGTNLDASALERWTPENTDTNVPRARYNRSFDILDRYVENASFIRAKNIRLGYTLPTGLVERAGAQQATVYVSAQNLFVLTDYSGYDPEVSRNGQNAASQGLDRGVYPRPRAFTFGVRLDF